MYWCFNKNVDLSNFVLVDIIYIVAIYWNPQRFDCDPLQKTASRYRPDDVFYGKDTAKWNRTFSTSLWYKCHGHDALRWIGEILKWLVCFNDIIYLSRRMILCIRLFMISDIHKSEHKLHSLLPSKRFQHYSISGAKPYPLPKLKTKRSRGSFINWALFNLQW